MKATDRARVLMGSPFFSAVPREHLAVLAEMMEVETFGAGSAVIVAGEAADRVYVLADGVLAVTLDDETIVRRLHAGDVLGEYGMLTNAVRTATVHADVDSTLLSLDYERFRAYLLRFPEALWVFFERAVRRLVEAERRAAG